jgi:4-amino-4-deoxy-L-arabinose transferase-like glycosyltransferase
MPLPAFFVVLFLTGGAFLPGALALLSCRSYRAANIIEWLLAATTLGILGIGWVALLLAELGRFSLLALGAIWAVAVVLLGWLAIRRSALRAWQEWLVAGKPTGLTDLTASTHALPRWELGILAAWLIAACVLFFRPHEFVVGGADAGVYVNLGASIARSGSIVLHDPLLASFGKALEPALLRALPAPEYTPYYYLPGFYVPDAPPGQIIPQFYPLYPVWQAVSYTLGQAPAELHITGLWAVLACLAAYVFVRRLWGWKAALLALGTLSLTGLQVWFARYPTSEMLTQYLFLVGAWAFTVWTTEERSHAVWPALAGAALGQLFLTRIDVFPFLAVLPLVFIWRRWDARAQRQDLWFYALFILLVAHSLVHGLWQSAPYFFNQIGFQTYMLGANQRYTLPLLVTVVASLILLVVLDRDPAMRGRLAEWLRHHRVAWSLPLALIVIGLAIYGYFVRPQVGQMTVHAYWYAGGSIPNLDYENLLRLGWYFTPFGVMLAAASVALMIVLEDYRRTAFFLGVGLFFSVFYLWRIQINPHQVYAMRRYVPEVVPFLVICVAWALNWVYEGRTRLWRTAGVVLAAAWVVALGMSARGLISHVDFRGLAGQVEQLNATFQPNSVIIYYDPTPVGLGDLFGTPLRFLYGHDVVVIRNMERLDQAAFRQLVSKWRTDGRTLYWVTPDGDFKWPLAVGQARELLRWPTRAKMLEPTYERRPGKFVTLEWWQKISVLQ